MDKFFITGLILLGVFLLIAFFGPLFAPFPVDQAERVRVYTQDGEQVVEASPLPPSSRHPLGTDTYGYDLLTIMLHGARFSLLTISVTAVLRVLLGLGIAFFLHRFSVSPQLHWVTGLSSVPSFLIIYFILYVINFNSPLASWQLWTLQTSLMVFFGIPGTLPALSQKIAGIRKSPYIEAAQSLGADRKRIFNTHVLPQMNEYLLILFSSETVSVIALLGQLGIFNIFMGGTKVTNQPILYHSVTHEWAGLVGQYRTRIFTPHWWIFLFPLLGYTLLLLAFYLTSRGVERQIQKRYLKAEHI